MTIACVKCGPSTKGNRKILMFIDGAYYCRRHRPKKPTAPTSTVAPSKLLERDDDYLDGIGCAMGGGDE